MTKTSRSDLKTLQFESVKVALKQNKDGYVLTLCIHPDDVPLDLLRDFVGSRYQVVMVRLNDEDQPMNREDEFDGSKAVRMAGILCKEPEFWEFLYDDIQIMNQTEKDATDWLRDALGVSSRSELKTNLEARARLNKINEDYMAWKRKS
jgi:hypothetical protein